MYAINIANLYHRPFSSPPVSNHISTCLHNLFWWRMRTRYATTEINGTRSPRTNRYNYRCSQMNCTCGSHAVPRKVCTPAKLARFPSDLRRLSRWILFSLALSLSLFSHYLIFCFTQRFIMTFPLPWLTKQLPKLPECFGIFAIVCKYK